MTGVVMVAKRNILKKKNERRSNRELENLILVNESLSRLSHRDNRAPDKVEEEQSRSEK